MSLTLLYGPPCSGKTTLVQFLKSEIPVEYVSVGELARKEILQGTETGAVLRYYLDNVLEYPPPIVHSLVEKEILGRNVQATRIIVDGYQKYLREARHFASFLAAHRLVIASVVRIHITLDEALKRASSRKICGACLQQWEGVAQTCPTCGSRKVGERDDDQETAITRRYGDYMREQKEIADCLAPFVKRTLDIEGGGARNEVYRKFKAAMLQNS